MLKTVWRQHDEKNDDNPFTGSSLERLQHDPKNYEGLTEVPEQAVKVYETSIKNLNSGEYSPGQWACDENGYFVIDYNYISGETGEVSICRNDNFVQRIFTVADTKTDGIFQTKHAISPYRTVNIC